MSLFNYKISNISVFLIISVAVYSGYIASINGIVVDDLAAGTRHSAVSAGLPQAVVKPIFQFASEWIHSHTQRVLDSIQWLQDQLQLNDDTQFVNKFDSLKHLTTQATGDVDGCTLCKLVIGGLKQLLTKYSYEELEWPIIQICYKLLVDDGERRYELCNGSVSQQGPHVAYVINASTPERICEFQNACFLNSSVSTVKHVNSLYSHEHIQRQNRRSKQHSNSKIHSGSSPVTGRRQEGRRGVSQVTTTPVTVVQLTDIHIDIRYKEGTLADCGLPICCSDKYGNGSAGPYGDYMCNIPPKTIELFLRKIAQINPDFILYSGDVSGSRLWDESQQELLNISAALITAITENIPNNTVYPSFGNHEMFPTNLYYKGNTDIVTLTNQLTDWWTPVAKFSSSQQTTMKEAAYYSIIVKPGLRLVTYNSDYMYTANFYNVINYDERTEVHNMMTFVEDQLKSARNSQEKVIIMGHHPTNSGDYLIEFGYWYKQLALNYTDVIVLLIAGHRHCDAFHLIYDAYNDPVSMIYLSTPITAGGTKNPAMRVYKLDPDTYELIDYDQFYFDLNAAVQGEEPEIVKLYSALTEYNLTDMSPLSWSCLVDRMEAEENLLLQHLRHYYIDSRDDLTCDATCQRQHICSLRHCTYDQHYYCINSQTPTSAGSCPLAEPPNTTVTTPPNTTVTTPVCPAVNIQTNLKLIVVIVLFTLFYC